jgi:hypothetical protein
MNRIYVVPTNEWYIERAVWLIAGIVLLSSTALAWLVDSRFIVFVAITGLTSIWVALTGLCPLGNILYVCGLRGRLADPSRPGLYVMAHDSWYLERRIYPTVGFNITLGSILSLTWSPWWLCFTAFVGVAMVWFAFTGFCILANVLYWIGAEPRLAASDHKSAADVDRLAGHEPALVAAQHDDQLRDVVGRA